MLVLSLKFGKAIKPQRRVLDRVRQAFGNYMTLDRIKPEIFTSIAIKQDLLPRDDVMMAMYHLSDVVLKALKSGVKTIFLSNVAALPTPNTCELNSRLGSSLAGHHRRRLCRKPPRLRCVRLAMVTAMMRFSRASWVPLAKKVISLSPSQLAAIASTFSKRFTWKMKWVSTPHA